MSGFAAAAAALNASVMDVFGERGAAGEPLAVIYAPASGAPQFIVNGVFDRYQIEVMAEDGASTSVKRSVLSVRGIEFPVGGLPRQGDRLEVQGLTFDVTDVQPDSFGWIILPLGLVA